MIIKREVYEQMIYCHKVPPEVGGIMGGRNGIIDTIVIDKGNLTDTGIKYIPNVQLMNQYIQKWYMEKINFYGMFHTHLPQWERLSRSDKKYIKKIMNHMPSEIECLYFPLVFPDYMIKSFRAVKRNGNIYVVNDNIKII